MLYTLWKHHCQLGDKASDFFTKNTEARPQCSSILQKLSGSKLLYIKSLRERFDSLALPLEPDGTHEAKVVAVMVN